MSLLSLSFTLGFVLIAMVLSLWLKLGLERDMVIATVRSAIQLIVVGYILKAVFTLNNPVFIVLMIVLMIGVATQNASKRGKSLYGVVWWRVLLALCVSEVVTQGLLLAMGVVPFTPRYVIPISGMIVGNSMIASSLLLNRLQSETAAHRAQVLATLALGGTPRQSILPYVKQAIRASLIPTIDSTKTTGLVQLPGMMTGLIIAGANPIEAVRYQLLILFVLMAGCAIASITLGFSVYPTLFNRNQQLMLQ
ncbi:iron export ABC transporter permease subunit FetB [Alicyclobacillaceae bacterium I2511]|nr:iron export ABC transporter permease subunit FetB [Alicyclobacillaceae bacterium I2511]